LLLAAPAFIFVWFVWPAAASSSEPAAAFSPAANELEQGKVVYGPDETTYLLIHAPVNEVWARLSDVDHWPAIFGDLETVRLIGKTGKLREYAFVTKTPLGKKRYALAFSAPRAGHLDWWMDRAQPSDIKDAAGYWQLAPFEGDKGTLVTYRGRYETAFPLPGFLRRRMAESLVTDLRTFVDRHPLPPPAAAVQAEPPQPTQPAAAAPPPPSP
jgi:hypothetical protein